MRALRLSLSAILATSAVLAPATAHAAGADGILHVSNQEWMCSDLGPGTEAQPFCTIQKAADIVEPGQTIRIFGSGFASMRLTRSGTPEAPIRIESYNKEAQYRIDFQSGNEISFAPGLHDVQISHLWAWSAVDRQPGTLSLAGTSSIRIDQSNISAYLDLTGAAKATVQRSRILNPVKVGPGATGVVLSTNQMTSQWQSTKPIITVDGAADTAITSNTIYRNHVGVSVAGSATGTRLTNNHFPPKAPYSPVQMPYDLTKPVIEVDGTSTPSTKLGYSAFSMADQPPVLYRWAGTSYAAITAFQSATGQGTADVTENFPSDTVPSNWYLAPELIDTADATAPGQLDTDMHGGARLRNPSKAGGTAPYHDRGAFERRPILDRGGVWVTRYIDSPDGMTVEVRAGFEAYWGGTKVTAAYDWGDGTTSTQQADLAPLLNGSRQELLPLLTHRYTAPGYRTVGVTLTLDGTPEQFQGGTTKFYAPQEVSNPTGGPQGDGGQLKADFNGDGYDDLVSWKSNWSYEGAFLQLGKDGGLADPVRAWDGSRAAWQSRVKHVTAGDFNGDGKAELGMFYQQANGFVGFYSLALNGSTFAEPKRLWEAPYWGTATRHVSTGDFNGDGRSDLALFYQYGGSDVAVFTLTAGQDGTLGGLAQQWRAPYWGPGTTSMTAGDFNSDGKADLALFYSYGGSHVAAFTLTAGQNGVLGGPVTRWNAPYWGGGTKFVQAGNFAGDARSDLALWYDYGNGHVTAFSLTSGADGAMTAGTIWDGPVWGNGTQFVQAGNHTTKSGRADLVVVYNYGGSTVKLFGISPNPAGGHHGPREFRYDTTYGTTRTLL